MFEFIQIQTLLVVNSWVNSFEMPLDIYVSVRIYLFPTHLIFLEEVKYARLGLDFNCGYRRNSYFTCNKKPAEKN